MKPISFILLLLLLGCNFKDPKMDGVVYKKSAASVKKYVFKNDSITQNLEISWVAADKIQFSLTSLNSRSGCKRELTGLAINRFAGLDPEMDEDEKGEAYPSEQFAFEKEKCQAYIRIAVDRKRVQVLTADCVEDFACPLTGLGIFK